MAVGSDVFSTVSPQKHNKGGRRVAFSDVDAKEGGRRDSCSPSIRRRRDVEHKKSCCFRCCACTCLSVLAILLIGLLLASTLVFFLQSELPRIRVETCSISSIDMTRTQVNGKTVFLTDLGTNILLNVTNRNERVAVSFGPLKANVSWEDIGVGEVRFAGFFLDSKLVSKLNVSTRVTGATLNEDDAEQLQKQKEEHNTVLTVVMRGTVGFHVGWFHLQRLPLLVRCSEINQAALEVGQDQECGVRIYAFS
ncbi:hypothetical protein MLD38_040081 [Melastoma candidum]|uniref:Uncharacterized protein n=1 Tax=Melastoma candidum TaxID=119954 RepID=A0ACB9L5Q5_9MYRT|nr:hypothetical protein MLD38_040081 [Melastoma candidum]